MIYMAKRQYNFSLPVEVVAAFEEAARPLGGKKKWMGAAAAMLMWLEATPDAKANYLRRISLADLPDGSFLELVQQAKARSAASTVDDREPVITESDSLEEHDVAAPPATPRKKAREAGKKH
jgi:hypothetical protein